MKWTEEMNLFIIRSYYEITAGAGTTSYRPLLHQRFVERFPQFAHVTVQRVADQYRFITRSDTIPATIRERVRLEVIGETGDRESMGAEAAASTTPRRTAGNRFSTRRSTLLHRPAEVSAEVRDEFQRACIEFSDMDPLHRPGIPRLYASPATPGILSQINDEIASRLCADMSLLQLQSLVYCGAVAAIRLHGQKIRFRVIGLSDKRDPPWKIRLERRRDSLRQDIARLIQISTGNASRRVRNKVQRVYRNYAIPCETPVVEILDTLKQKLSVICSRLRRYGESYSRRVQNATYARNQRSFFRSLNESQQSAQTIQFSVTEAKEYWGGLWGLPAQHAEHAEWITAEGTRHANTPGMNFADVTEEEVRRAINISKNWRGPGLDRVQNFWYKKFTSVHSRLARSINEVMSRPEEFPPFLTAGITYLIPKKDTVQDPADTRPITCLPTLYKFITSIISGRINAHLETNNILSEEQKGCRVGSRGCKEQLIIDSVVVGQATRGQRNLFSCYIDYAKAFDSVPHTWLIDILHLYRIDPKLIKFLATVMEGWHTTLSVRTSEGANTSEPIRIRRGIFQGDSLSPLWFCMALNPLSWLLNDARGHGFAIKYGLRAKCELTHLMYLDDIKLYAGTDNHLRSLLRIIDMFSRDIRMEFGLDKCRIQAIRKGHHEPHAGHSIGDLHIEAMTETDFYKYLGILQGTHARVGDLKEALLSEFLRRVKLVLKSHLSGKNKISALNVFAIPSLAYAFGILPWTKTDLENVQRRIRTTMSKFRMHHPKSAVERMNLPRDIGGRGVVDVAAQHHRQVDSLRAYFYSKEQASPLHAAVCKADCGLTPLNLKDRSFNPLSGVKSDQERIDEWKSKAMHGKHVNCLWQPFVDLHLSNRWLCAGELFAETEGFMCAIQDGVVATRAYKKLIMKERVENDQCRMCGSALETLDHLISGCTVMAPVQYITRHNAVCKVIHQNLAYKHGLITGTCPVYRYEPQAVLDSSAYSMYWDRQVLTDRHTAHNKPDVLLVDKTGRSAYIIDVAIPHNSNIERKYVEKKVNYEPLAREIKEIWRLERVVVVPIILSATGIVPKSLTASLDVLGLSHSLVQTMQKYTILHTCSMLRGVLDGFSH